MKARHYLVSGAILCLAVWVAACNQVAPASNVTGDNLPPAPADIKGFAQEFIDNDTGCHYFAAYGHMITVRYDEFGKPMCSQTRD